MAVDKVLQRLELENRKELLKGVEEQALNEELYIIVSRGIYNIKFKGGIRIIADIQEEIKEIDRKLEELTGINQNKIERLYEV